MKKHLLLISVLFLCLSSATAKKEQPLRLLYWNIQNGMWDGQTDDYQRFTDWVRQQNPDICVWCEAHKNYKTNSDKGESEKMDACKSRWERLAKRYGHKYVYLSAVRDNYPQMITSKYPIETVKLMIGNKRDSIVAHGAGWFKLKMGKKDINIVTLHTWPQGFGFGIKDNKEREASKLRNDGDKYRRMELEYICKETILQNKKSGKELWMMMGDFNAKSPLDDDIYKHGKGDTKYLTHTYILENTPYLDLIKEKHPDTFEYTTGSKNRIDFIYTTKPLLKKVVDANVLNDAYTKPVRNPQKISNFWHPSDHLPILVNFDLNK